MFSHAFYNVVHILGIALLVTAIGGVALHALNGGTRASNAGRGLVGALHGVGALLILVGGFGMLARLGVKHGDGFPGWVFLKLVIWALLAAALFLPYRRPAFAKPVLLLAPLLGGLAAWAAIFKPF